MCFCVNNVFLYRTPSGESMVISWGIACVPNQDVDLKMWFGRTSTFLRTLGHTHHTCYIGNYLKDESSLAPSDPL